jgi:hypothetical protein
MVKAFDCIGCLPTMGPQGQPPYELFLYFNDIEHTCTKVRSPQTNGAVGRLHQTIQDEFYQFTFRKKLCRSQEDIQIDLDAFMYQYNLRTNQGRYYQGRTPLQTFLEDLELYQRHGYEKIENKEAA